MKRSAIRSFLGLGLALVVLGGFQSSALAATPAPATDYRFNGNLKSSVHTSTVPRLQKVGDPAGYVFGAKQINGKRNRLLSFAEGAGLRLPTAKKAIGTGDDYTIAMLVRLNDIDGYRKLVDLSNLKLDEGWYQYEGYIYPYDVGTVEEPAELPIQAQKWHRIVLTRVEGDVKGYVDGTRYFTESDSGQEVLGPDEILHFLMDDESTGTEETAGKVARLRTWKNPLTNNQAANLGY